MFVRLDLLNRGALRRLMIGWAVTLAGLAGGAGAEPAVAYQLRYDIAAADRVTVSLAPPQPMPAPLSLVAARGYPGGYAQVPYDAFMSGVVARAPDGSGLAVVKDADGPRWRLGRPGELVASVDYDVDVAAMERGIHDAVASSKLRNGYAGLLGYSIFAFLEGMEDRRIRLTIEAPDGWPALTTLGPAVPPGFGRVTAEAADFYQLADSQVLMGPALQITQIDGKIPLVMAIYAEGEVDATLEARLARHALDCVQAYFGDTPFASYTVQLELLRPLPDHAYGFSQEHIDSGSFSLSLEAALTVHSTAAQRDRVEFNFAHHMAHSWIPKRAYGVGYRPFLWEMTPVIDSIWFNEGFGRYAAIAAMAAGLPQRERDDYRQKQLAGLRAMLDASPPFIRRMSLATLSREASFLYGADFRTGRAIFARGALMAAEIDDRIRSRSGDAKSLRDAIQGLLRWSAASGRAFNAEELPEIFKSATGVAVEDIIERWQQPLLQ